MSVRFNLEILTAGNKTEAQNDIAVLESLTKALKETLLDAPTVEVTVNENFELEEKTPITEVVEEAPKPKRRRRASEKPAKAEEPKAEEPKAEEPKAEEPKAEATDGVSDDEVRAKAKELFQGGKIADVKAIIDEYSVQNVVGLPAEGRAKLMGL